MPGWTDPLSWLKTVAAASLVGVGCAGALLYTYQCHLIYPANLPPESRKVVPKPDEFGMPFEDLTLTTPDGVKIRAYLMLQRDEAERRPTVLLLHANAGNVGHRLPIARVFYTHMKCNVFALSYRGYGLSEGSPNEKGLRIDAQTALDHIVSHAKLEKTSIVVYGQSIGGAVSIDLAARNRNRVNALVVENTFLSLPKLVPRLMPYLKPFMFLLHQTWPSDRSIQSLPRSMPVLFLSGARDELIPPDHMDELFRLCASDKKERTSFPDGDHNATCLQRGYFERIQAFIDKHLSRVADVDKSDELVDEKDQPPKSPSERTESSFEMLEKEDDEQDDGAAVRGAGSMADLGDIARAKLEQKL